MAALVCKGELYKLGGGAIQRLQKRYFELRENGSLTYYEKPGGEEKGVVYVEGAKVVDRGTFQGKLCFSIEGMNVAKGVKEYFLFADDAASKWMWYQQIQRLTKRYCLSSSSTTDTDASQLDARILRSPVYRSCLAERDDNKVCADCNAPNPTWSVLKPFGCFVCIECVGVHRSLWASSCKEIELDRWNEEEIAFIEHRGNKVVNEELEFHVPSNDKKPNRWSARQLRERFICKKYQDQAFSVSTREGDQSQAAVSDDAVQPDPANHTAAGSPPRYIGVVFFQIQEAQGYASNGCVAALTNGFQEVRTRPGSKTTGHTMWGQTLQIGVDHLQRPLYVTLYESESKIAATAEIILSNVDGLNEEDAMHVSVPLTGKSISDGAPAFLHCRVTFTKLT